MVGGLLRVPVEETEQFFVQYINEVITGKVYLVEKITLKFRFFVDLDWVGSKPDYRRVIEEANRVVPGRIEVAVTPMKIRGTETKYGMHLHWPDLIVGKTEALELRERLPDEIRQFADKSVYSTGLRMLWSHKKDGSLPYVPLGHPKPDVGMLRLFSIRVGGQDSPPVANPTNSPLLQFIREYIPGQANTRITKTKRSGQITRLETDSRYCERIRKEHRSNHIFFEVTKDTIRQRCYDEDCKHYEGKIYKLSPSVLDALKGAIHADDSSDFLDSD